MRILRLCLVMTLGAVLIESVPCDAAQTKAKARGRSSASGVESRQNAGPLAAIGPVIEKAIKDAKCPGAVVLIGARGKVVYRRAFGRRAIVPRPLPMRIDTIFDVASLTKVVATTTAVMQLVEQGKIRLEQPVTDYWPEFGSNGKGEITVRELMTHYSGLRGDLDLKLPWSGYEMALRMIAQETPIVPPGTSFIYRDITYETLGELVRRASGRPLDVSCREPIFRTADMK